MGVLDGRVAIVTGGGSGIGRAVALRFAREGADVVVADVNAESGSAVAAEVRAIGRRGLAVPTDVADIDQVQALVDRTVAEFGRIDVLMNNAGIVQVRRLLDLTPEDWDRMFAVNARGAFFVMQRVARQMVRQQRGKIINTASIAAWRGGLPVTVHYAATKAVVVSFTRTAAQALAPYHVNVNAICPGVVETPMWAKIDEEWSALEGWPRGEAWRRRTAGIPLGRPETPEDVTGLCVFLAGPDSDYLTGQAINVDGGLVMG